MADLDRFQYLLLMGACLVVTLPLELVLGARVWRQPRRLLGALAVPAVVFLVWDVWAIGRGHWTFSDRFTTGWNVAGVLPVEEISFFVVIPVCGLLTFEAVRRLREGPGVQLGRFHLGAHPPQSPEDRASGEQV